MVLLCCRITPLTVGSLCVSCRLCRLRARGRIKEGGQTWQWVKRTKPAACRPGRNTRSPRPWPGILRHLAMDAEVVATLELLQRAATTLLWAGAGGFDVKEKNMNCGAPVGHRLGPPPPPWHRRDERAGFERSWGRVSGPVGSSFCSLSSAIGASRPKSPN